MHTAVEASVPAATIPPAATRGSMASDDNPAPFTYAFAGYVAAIGKEDGAAISSNQQRAALPVKHRDRDGYSEERHSAASPVLSPSADRNGTKEDSMTRRER